MPLPVDLLKRLLHLTLAFTACLHLCGGPLGMLQGIAWMKMLVTYSQADGLMQGVKKTFDGAHPCALCQKIATAKNTSQPQPEAPDTKIAGKAIPDFAMMDEINLPVRSGSGHFTTRPGEAAPQLPTQGCLPAVPPPRLS